MGDQIIVLLYKLIGIVLSLFAAIWCAKCLQPDSYLFMELSLAD